MGRKRLYRELEYWLSVLRCRHVVVASSEVSVRKWESSVRIWRSLVRSPDCAGMQIDSGVDGVSVVSSEVWGL